MRDERERDLEQLAKQLGAGADDHVDPARVSAAVLARLGARPAARPWWQRAKLMPLVAAAAVVLAVGFGLREFAHRSGADVTATVPVELQELAVAELSEVLDSLELDAPVAELVPVGLYDLDESELGRLLESMEG